MSERSIGYQPTAEGALNMDVYVPPALPQSERCPAVVFVHGGPISPLLSLPPTDWGVFRGYGALAAASGWIGVTFNHRYFGIDQLEPAARDIAAAVAYLREHAPELQVDGDRLCLWAFSGGGAFLADTLREPPPCVRCLVAYYSVLDLRPLAGVELRKILLFMPRKSILFLALYESQAGGQGVPPRSTRIERAISTTLG